VARMGENGNEFGALV